MKLKLFMENYKDEDGNKVRYCPNPECKIPMHFDRANMVNNIPSERWNDKRIGILCCYCVNIIKFYNNDSIDISSKSRAEMIMKKKQTIYGDIDRLSLRIEGLRKLKLIA